MRFPPTFLDSIRARIAISEVVGQRVTWDKRKSQPQRGDFWACCPFHGEKTPSFHADDRRGRYHCFGCGVSGDHFTFLVEQDGLSFPEAVEQLAGEAGLPMPARDEAEEKREKQRASLADVMELAAKFFEAQLQAAIGAKARGYLRDRGISSETQTRFHIGFAPDSRKALKEHLAGKGVLQEQMIEAGLLIAGDDIPVSYDRFRDRVIFPITDLRGRVIAFGGRALSADQPAKYLNSPETPLFSKSHVLFNGREARAAVRKGGHVIAVEGYTDVIACVAAGFEATVAPMGTALTEDQLRLLWQMADEPILCFDGDTAGLKAAYRAIDLALPHLQPGKSLRFALLPGGRDPDDVIRKEGAAAFEAVLTAAEPLSQFVLDRELGGIDLNIPEHRSALERKLYKIAASISDRIVSRHYRDFFRLRMSDIFWKSDGRSAKAESIKSYRLSVPENIEKIIIGLCVDDPTVFHENEEELMKLSFKNMRYNLFLRKMGSLFEQYNDISVNEIYEDMGEEFYDVLDDCHGAPKGMIINIRTREKIDGQAGHKLRILFPALNLLPDVDILIQTLNHFMILHKLKCYETDLENRLQDLTSFDDFNRELQGLEEFRTMVAESERELDAKYQRLRFRPSNDDQSVGLAVLGDHPIPWRAVSVR